MGPLCKVIPLCFPPVAPRPPLPGPKDSCEAYKCVLGPDKASYEVPRLHGDEECFFVEGLSFPDAGFPGLVSFHVTLLDDSNEVGVAGLEGEKWALLAPRTPGFFANRWLGSILPVAF